MSLYLNIYILKQEKKHLKRKNSTMIIRSGEKKEKTDTEKSLLLKAIQDNILKKYLQKNLEVDVFTNLLFTKSRQSILDMEHTADVGTKNYAIT